MIILTSFHKSRSILKRLQSRSPNIYSVARKQPAGYSYPNLPFLAAIDIHGQKINLHGVEDPINSYRRTLYEYYNSVCDDIMQWVVSLESQNVDIICCWCPYSISTKEQIRVHGTFVCHTGLIGKIINEYRPDIEVFMDTDRAMRMIKDYKPIFKTLIM